MLACSYEFSEFNCLDERSGKRLCCSCHRSGSLGQRMQGSTVQTSLQGLHQVLDVRYDVAHPANF